MIERIEGIVTDIIKHNDSHNVVTLYTRGRGRMAFLTPISKTKNGRMRAATLSLMAVVGCDVNIRPGKELYTLRRPEALRLWHGIYGDPVKTSLVFFLSEFLSRLIRQYPADQQLWDYLIGALETLDRLPASRIANFHVAFLMGLLPIAGIEPPARRWEQSDRFNMLTGEMVAVVAAPGQTADPHLMRNLLPEEESRLVPLMLRMRFGNMHCFRFTRSQRQHLLGRLLAYYSVHLPIGTEYKSLGVLQELFA